MVSTNRYQQNNHFVINQKRGGEMSGTKQTKKSAFLPAVEDGVALSPTEIDRFLVSLQKKGRVDGTLQWYRRGLNQLYEALPNEKFIGVDTLSRWRDSLLQDGYAANTVNQFMAAVNSYLAYAGKREYQITNQLKVTPAQNAVLTRKEYQQLLRKAKLLGRERIYLLVKLFGSCELPVQELEKLTVETAKKGVIRSSFKGIEQQIILPAALQQELLDYAKREGVLSGPLFLTREGKAMSRTNVTVSIRQLCIAAGVDEEKGSPRCLKNMYLATRESIEQEIAAIREKMYSRILEQEQSILGWKE